MNLNIQALLHTLLIFGLAFRMILGIGLRCDMIPEGVSAPRNKDNANRYRIEISGNPDSYVPGEQYTVFLRSASKGKEKDDLYKFTHFIMSVGKEKTTGAVETGVNIGTIQLYGDASTKFSENCENAVVESDVQLKSEIQILWLAPPKGSGCIKFRATVVESKDMWFSEDEDLTKVICEEIPDTEDTQPKILKECCTCDEAKYESDQIRTIIKARGISYPNVTGKTFAVFRVDNRHHLMSIVSMIDPSPDWIVGVSSLELCLRNCSWMESKILNLYPWDIGTDDGITYLSSNQPSLVRLPIRRLNNNSPDDPRSPFYDRTDSLMKPFARLTLTRQRLYEKTCDLTAVKDPEDSNGLCETTEWSVWSPCSATCGRGVKYKQRRYVREESKYICQKKLTERAGCEAVMKYCPRQPLKPTVDPLCELGPWSEWSSCSATCGKGTKTRDRKYKNRFAAKSCSASKSSPPIMQQNLECWSVGLCDDFSELKDDCSENPWTDWSPCSASCGRGFKERFRLSLEYNADKTLIWPLNTDLNQKNKDRIRPQNAGNNLKIRETVECLQKPCDYEIKRLSYRSEAACGLPKDVGACKSNLDRWYFDGIRGQCEIFSYSGCEGNLNNFNTLEQCQILCARYQKELIANLTTRKKHLDVTVSGVLSYNIQNDAFYGNNCVSDDSITSIESNGSPSTKAIKKDLKIDCKISKWSGWGKCNVSNGVCGYGSKVKYRYIVVHEVNGGEPCPKKLKKEKRCKIRCTKSLHQNQY